MFPFNCAYMYVLPKIIQKKLELTQKVILIFSPSTELGKDTYTKRMMACM